jgi:hypothetical protein
MTEFEQAWAERDRTEFEKAWAVVRLDYTPIEGEEAAIRDVLRVFWTEEDALAEVERLKDAHGTDDRSFYYEETEVKRP